MIGAAHADESIWLFEELDSERRCTKQGIENDDRDATVFRMKDAKNFCDTVGIRMNADDSVYALFEWHVFMNA